MNIGNKYMRHETMKSTDQHKSVKNILNETLSATVKQLHQECALKSNNLQTVQSDSDIAQQLVAVLEAAFIHGLRQSYYEKRKHKELPKPQFWNIINKISHKDILQQTQRLNLIRNHIGQCRAWLRLALNDGALSSYLSSLLQTTEFKSLLNRYYDVYALFRDHEQSDIFLRYLQGAENLSFDLSYNSSILNSWTKTPLELAGIISSNNPKQRLAQMNNNNRISSDAIRHSSSWGQLATPHSPIVNSRRGSINSNYLSTSPALSISSQISSTFPSIQIIPSTVEENSNLVEVAPDAGQALPSHNNLDLHNCVEFDGTVLHKRHVMRRKSKTPRKKRVLEFTSSGSRCSSISSLSSNISVGSVPFRRVAQDSPIGSQASSLGSYDTPPSGASDSNHYAVTSTVDQSEDRLSSNDKSFIPPSTCEVDGSTDALQSNSSSRINRASSLRENEDTFINSMGIDHNENRDNQTDGGLNPDDLDQDCQPPVSQPLGSSLQDRLAFPSNLEKGPDVVNDVNSTLPSSDPYQDEEQMDFYAMHSSMSTASNPEVDPADDDIYAAQKDVTSPGHGNSLMCSTSWTSDHANHISDQLEKRPSLPIVTPPTPLSEEMTSSVGPSQHMSFICRKGFLQKKGETLLFWRSRWFVLKDGILTYYKDRKSNVPLGTIPLCDVETIDDREISKNKSICMKMRDGTEHQLAAESRELISEWARDFHTVVDEIQLGLPVEEFVASIEPSYEVLEDFNIVEENRLDPSDVNTSWLASMKSHLTKIANEKGLDAQNYQCADCAAPILVVHSAPRLCTFTGQYHCSQCHTNEESAIPARMIHNWDFKKHKVSIRSKRFLDDIWRDPCIEMDRVNPVSYRHIPEMKRLLKLRSQLAALHPYLSTCRKIKRSQITSKLKGHHYMMENAHLYSANDLQETFAGNLIDVINKAVTYFTNHVRTCDLCSVKGFICEICKDKQIIFAFETKKTIQCEDCKSVYHKNCLPDILKCPKCVRRHQRIKMEEESSLEEQSDDQRELEE